MDNPHITTAAILAIGDELTCGYRLDTNSQTIARRLTTVPLEVTLHLTVGDTVTAIHAGLRTALAAAPVVIATGGLGPTEDDVTRQAVAAYFGLELVENAEALARIQERFARRGRTMPQSNRIQAHIPAGSTIIQNDRGTAPGFYIEHDGRHLFVTPGIPYEMEGMLEGFILPRLRHLVGGGHTFHRAALKVYGLPESEINERLRPLLARGRNPLLGLLPHRGTITVEIVAHGATEAEAQALLAADLAHVRAALGQHIISEDERDLPQVVHDLLRERGLTVAVAEMGTGGLVAAQLTRPPGGTEFHRGLVLSPSPAEGRDEAALADEAQALAETARQVGDADVGVGVGPLIVPSDSTPQRPYALLYAAVDVRGKSAIRRISLSGEPAIFRRWAADGVLALVREAILASSPLEGGEHNPTTPVTPHANHLAGLHREVWTDLNTDDYLQQERDGWASDHLTGL